MKFEIKKITLKDAEKIRIWRNDQINVLRQDKIINKTEQREYYQQNVFPQYINKKPNLHLLGIHKHNKLIAYGGLVYINFLKSEAEVSFLVDSNISNDSDDYEEIFSFFLNIISKIAFEKFQLKLIYTETNDFRIKHITILENNSFIKKGIVKKGVVENGITFNTILHTRNLGE